MLATCNSPPEQRSNGISSYNTARLLLGCCVQMNILIEWLLADAFVNRVGEMKQAEENALTRI